MAAFVHLGTEQVAAEAATEASSWNFCSGKEKSKSNSNETEKKSLWTLLCLN